MSWPPTPNSAVGFLATGVTSIRWGTDGIMPNTSPNGSGGGYGGFYTVESMRSADEIDNIYIAQGSGLKATRIQLIQGRSYTITMVDDTFFTLTSASNYIELWDVISGGTVQYANCRVTQNGYSANRGVEGKRELTVEVLTLIELNGAVPAA